MSPFLPHILLMLEFTEISKASLFSIGLKTRLNIIRVLAIGGVSPILEILSCELPKLSVDGAIFILFSLLLWLGVATLFNDGRRRYLSCALRVGRDWHSCCRRKEKVIGGQHSEYDNDHGPWP